MNKSSHHSILKHTSDYDDGDDARCTQNFKKYSINCTIEKEKNIFEPVFF